MAKKYGNPDGAPRPPDLPGEAWLPVPGYEGLYEASDAGRIWTKRRRGSKGGLLKPVPDEHGYGYVTLWSQGDWRRIAVHQVVMLAFAGAPTTGQEIRHLDGKPGNCRLSNLTYGTHSDNMRDEVRHGTHANASKTHCPADHEYTPENTFINKAGSRVCIECSRRIKRESAKRRKAPSGGNDFNDRQVNHGI